MQNNNLLVILLSFCTELIKAFNFKIALLLNYKCQVFVYKTYNCKIGFTFNYKCKTCIYISS